MKAAMKILNFGSLNIDYVYRVPHIVRPGETLASEAFEVFAGGKGANQSAALAKAGANVSHAGRIGSDGAWVLEKLGELGVKTEHVEVGDARTGHAIIQVDRSGQNAIVLYPGANVRQRRSQIDAVLAAFEAGSTLLLQNEVNDIAYLIEAGHARGLKVCLNPAPMTAEVAALPLDLLDTLVVNEVEAAGLVGPGPAHDQMARLATRLPECDLILTQGEAGCLFHGRATAPTLSLHVPALPVQAIDTTAAGDTFLGFFLACRAEGASPREALQTATAAAAICVTRSGAMDSIPTRAEVAKMLSRQ